MLKVSRSTENSRRLRRCRHWLCLSLTALALVLGGCGGSKDVANTKGAASTSAASTSTATTAVDPGSEPNAVVARVAGHAITKAQYAHALAGRIKFEQLQGFAPIPPRFTACIAHLEASSTSGTKPSGTALKAQCESQYKELVKEALGPLISAQWVLGAATEAGLSVSEAEVRAQVKREEGHSTQAQVLASLAKRDETLAEFASEVKVDMLAEKIRHMLKAKAEHLTSSQVAAYYETHKSQYATPARRSLYIARTATEAEALKVKREIAAGTGFASVVKRLPLQQPIYSVHGYVAEYEPNLYSEAPLNNAIFAAKPNFLSDPVKIYLGYYVFEVKRALPAVQEPLSQAKAAIRAQLPYQRYKQALAAYVAKLRAHWRALTTCLPGYVVAKCAGASSEPEDAYTIG
jgi:PPIC-type PPIASE domain